MDKKLDGVMVVWLGTYLGNASVDEFEEFFKEEGFTVEFVEEFTDNDNHKNIIFRLLDNVSKFAIFRLSHIDMKWWEDYIVNYYNDIPQEIKERYNVPMEVEL